MRTVLVWAFVWEPRFEVSFSMVNVEYYDSVIYELSEVRMYILVSIFKKIFNWERYSISSTIALNTQK